MKQFLTKQNILKIALALIFIAVVVLTIFRTSIFPQGSFMYDLYNFNVKNQTGVRIMKTLVIVCAFSLIILVSDLVTKLGEKINNNSVKTIVLLVGNVLKYVSVITMLFYILSAWGVDTTVLVTGAGLLALIIGLGCQALVSDIVAGLFMIFEGDIKVGDIVVINGWRGTVQQIGLRRTKIEDAVGNVNIVNNSSISNIINNTQLRSVAVIDVGIEYNESIQRVESILSENMQVFRDNIPAIAEGPFYKGVSALGDSSVDIRLVAKCKEEDKYQVERDMNREIKILFDKYNINIPFTQVVLNYRDENDELKTAKKKELRSSEQFVKEQKELSKNIDEQPNS